MRVQAAAVSTAGIPYRRSAARAAAVNVAAVAEAQHVQDALEAAAPPTPCCTSGDAARGPPQPRRQRRLRSAKCVLRVRFHTRFRLQLPGAPGSRHPGIHNRHVQCLLVASALAVFLNVAAENFCQTTSRKKYVFEHF